MLDGFKQHDLLTRSHGPGHLPQRDALAVGFLSLAVGLLVRVAPATPQPLPWVSLGTTIVSVWWVIVSVGFYLYLTTLAVYEVGFGSLASVIAVMACLYISTTAFLFGAQLDAIIRAQATWDPSWRPSRSVAAVWPRPSVVRAQAVGWRRGGVCSPRTG